MAGTAAPQSTPFLHLFRRHLYHCQEIPILFQGPGVGSIHEKQQIQYLICYAKICIRKLALTMTDSIFTRHKDHS